MYIYIYICNTLKSPSAAFEVSSYLQILVNGHWLFECKVLVLLTCKLLQGKHWGWNSQCFGCLCIKMHGHSECITQASLQFDWWVAWWKKHTWMQRLSLRYLRSFSMRRNEEMFWGKTFFLLLVVRHLLLLAWHLLLVAMHLLLVA